MKIIRFILRFGLLLLNLAAAVLLLIAALAPICSPARLVLPSILALGFEWLLLINLIFGLFWLFTKHKAYIILSLLTLLCSTYSIQQTISFRVSTENQKLKTNNLSILTYNTCRMGNFLKPAQNGLLHYLRKQEADIVCLQEIETYKKSNKYLTLDELKDYLRPVYPYSFIDFKQYRGNRQYGVAVFSKYPIIHKTPLSFESRSNIANYCDVVVHSDTFRLFNNHLESYKLKRTDFDNPQLSTINCKLSTINRLRAAEAEVVKQHINASPYPVIVCGDMNDVPQSYTLRCISNGLQDAFLQSTAWQLGHTITKKGVGARIDYILHSSSFSSFDYQRDKVVFSDHYPIRCTLSY